VARQAILDTDATLLDPVLHELLREWLAVGLAIGCEHADARPVGTDLPATPTWGSWPGSVVGSVGLVVGRRAP
jgi:hypothetical protein